MAGNAGGIAGGDPGRLRSPGRARAARMPVRRWTEPAPPTVTAVVKATACAGSRTGRSAGGVNCFSSYKELLGGRVRTHRLRDQPATALTVVMAIHPHPFDPRTTYRCMLAERCHARPGAAASGASVNVRDVLESGARAGAVEGVVAVVAAGAARVAQGGVGDQQRGLHGVAQGQQARGEGVVVCRFRQVLPPATSPGAAGSGSRSAPVALQRAATSTGARSSRRRGRVGV